LALSVLSLWWQAGTARANLFSIVSPRLGMGTGAYQGGMAAGLQPPPTSHSYGLEAWEDQNVFPQVSFTFSTTSKPPPFRISGSHCSVLEHDCSLQKSGDGGKFLSRGIRAGNTAVPGSADLKRVCRLLGQSNPNDVLLPKVLRRWSAAEASASKVQ